MQKLISEARRVIPTEYLLKRFAVILGIISLGPTQDLTLVLKISSVCPIDSLDFLGMDTT
jgi:hypothetical protein